MNPDRIVSVGGNRLIWPLEEQHVTIGQRHAPLETAVVAVFLVLLGIAYGVVSRDVLSIFRYLGDIPASAVLSLLAILATWGIILVGLLWTGIRLFLGDPVGRPFTVVWAVLAVTAAMVDAAPGWIWFLVVLLGLCVAVLYLSPWASRAFAAQAAAAERPTPITFSIILVTALFTLSALYALALVPGLGRVSEMNEMGQWMDEGSLGTKFVIGFLMLVVSLIAGFLGVSKVRNREVSGRVILTGLAVLNAVALWLALGSFSSGVGGSLAPGGQSTLLIATFVIMWGAILTPLWLGSSAARWFDTSPVISLTKTTT